MSQTPQQQPPGDVVTYVRSKGKVKKYVNGKPVKSNG